MSTQTDVRPVCVITGASGGMGRACSRLLGRRYQLVLTDIRGEDLAAEAQALEQEGYKVAAHLAGDLADAAVCQAIAVKVQTAGRPGALIHTAGLSPALAGWEAIVRANLVATEHLLGEFESLLTSGFVAVLVASIAGHMAPADAELDQVLSDPLAADLLQRVQPWLQKYTRPDDPYGLASPAYGVTKRAVIAMAERRAGAWGARGARIVSLSPGTIWTPMGRTEAENNPGAAAVVAATPAGRWGTSMDIASAVEFLTSDVASFITGTDLRIDGGVTPVLRQLA